MLGVRLLDLDIDPALRRRVPATLDGRLDFRELAGDPAMQELVRDGVRQFDQAWEDASTERRAQWQSRVRDASRRLDHGLGPEA